MKTTARFSLILQQCFGFALSKYPHIGELIRISKIRNAVVHEGTKWLGISVIQFEYGRLRKLELLVLDFAEWIEQQIRKADDNRTAERPHEGV